jgi:hypothetical protein
MIRAARIAGKKSYNPRYRVMKNVSAMMVVFITL